MVLQIPVQFGVTNITDPDSNNGAITITNTSEQTSGNLVEMKVQIVRLH